jgi:hypothetical protein
VRAPGRPRRPRPLGPRMFRPGPLGPRTLRPGPLGPRTLRPGPLGPRTLRPGPLGPRTLRPGPLGPRTLRPGPLGPRTLRPGPLGPRTLRPGPLGPRTLRPGPLGPSPSVGTVARRIIARRIGGGTGRVTVGGIGTGIGWVAAPIRRTAVWLALVRITLVGVPVVALIWGIGIPPAPAGPETAHRWPIPGMRDTGLATARATRTCTLASGDGAKTHPTTMALPGSRTQAKSAGPPGEAGHQA